MHRTVSAALMNNLRGPRLPAGVRDVVGEKIVRTVPVKI